MPLVSWGLVTVYWFLAVAVLVGLFSDGWLIFPGNDSNALWLLACASLMLLISVLWPLSLASSSCWCGMEE